jgi:hypothetical protein
MILIAKTELPTIFFLAVLGLTIGMLLLRSHRYLSRQRRNDNLLVDLRRPETAQRVADSPPEVARCEVQMHETARDLSAEIDSRVSVLRAMVAEADRAAARLEAACRQAGAGEAGRAATGPVNQPELEAAAASPSSENGREAVYTLSDYGYSSNEIAARLRRPVGEVKLILGLREP